MVVKTCWFSCRFFVRDGGGGIPDEGRRCHLFSGCSFGIKRQNSFATPLSDDLTGEQTGVRFLRCCWVCGFLIATVVASPRVALLTQLGAQIGHGLSQWGAQRHQIVNDQDKQHQKWDHLLPVNWKSWVVLNIRLETKSGRILPLIYVTKYDRT